MAEFEAAVRLRNKGNHNIKDAHKDKEKASQEPHGPHLRDQCLRQRFSCKSSYN